MYNIFYLHPILTFLCCNLLRRNEALLSLLLKISAVEKGVQPMFSRGKIDLSVVYSQILFIIYCGNRCVYSLHLMYVARMLPFVQAPKEAENAIN